MQPSDKMRREAERDCTALFLEFQRNGLQVPAHTQPKAGQIVALPDSETTMKYAAIYRTLKAARKKTELPGLAASLVRHQLALKATANDEKGHLRCKNCGQFASQYREHTCPRTATAARMEQHVRARLGIPAGCYATPDGDNLLQMLITESNTPGSRGMVKLVHPLIGESQEATLDGALLAIRSGYLPQSWQTAASFGGFELKQVVTPKGQTAYVAEAKSLALATLAKVPPVSVSTNSITQAATAYGLSPATASQYQHQPAPTALPAQLAIATAAANSPQALSFSGGTSYDLGRFSGTEFRKDNGQSIAGTPFYVGQEFTGSSYFASARSSGGPGGQPLYPVPPGSKLRAGRTLVAATPAVNVTVQAPEVAANAAPLTAQFDAVSSEQFAQALGAKLAEGLRPLVESQTARNIGAAVGVNTNASSTDPLTQDALAGISAALTTLANRLPGATEEKLANALDRLATRLDTLPLPLSGTPAPVPAANNNATPAPASVPPSANRERVAAKPAPVRPEFAGRHANPVEHILARVEPLSPPDPYLMSVPPELGGHRIEPLPQYYQELDPHYEVSADSQKALELVTASLQKAWDSAPTKRPPGTQYRSFAFAGTAGTGKNTTARQIAAALRLPYYEMTVNKDTSFQEEIGQTVLTTDPTSGATVSRAQLGKLGQVAASGGIICVNEIIKANPGMQGALQTMIEDGFVEIAGTEAGMAGWRIPVHPSTVFISTFNPGYDGSAARPDGALLSRMQTVIMNAPSAADQARRLGSEMERLFGVGKLPASEVDRKEQERMSTMLAKDYKIRQPTAISKKRLEAAANFFSEVRQLAQTRQIAATSTHVAEPSPREVARFLAISEATGDPKLALEQLKVYCDPGELHAEQWKQVQMAFATHYGQDGQALNRAEAGNGPQQH